MADIVAEGGILIEEKKFKWIINNFDIIMKREDLLQLQKFEFKCVDSNGVKSCWQAWMKYDDEAEPESNSIEGKVIYLYLDLMEKGGYATHVDAQDIVTIENSAGETICRGRSCQKFRHVVEHSYYWRINKLRRKSEAKSVNRTLIITFTLKIFTMKTASSLGDQIMMSETDADLCDNWKQQIYQTIGMLENDKDNSDVKIISSDGEEFYAYGWILSEVSEVFKDMLSQSEQSEKEPGFTVLKVKDVSGTTMKMLLHFIYTGNLDPEWSLPGNVTKFVYTVIKFEIEDLKNFLDACLGKVCTPENAGELLAIAENAFMKKAVRDILAFIRQEIKFKDPQKFFNIAKKMKTE